MMYSFVSARGSQSRFDAQKARPQRDLPRLGPRGHEDCTRLENKTDMRDLRGLFILLGVYSAAAAFLTAPGIHPVARRCALGAFPHAARRTARGADVGSGAWPNQRHLHGGEPREDLGGEQGQDAVEPRAQAHGGDAAQNRRGDAAGVAAAGRAAKARARAAARRGSGRVRRAFAGGGGADGRQGRERGGAPRAQGEGRADCRPQGDGGGTPRRKRRRAGRRPACATRA